MAPPRSTEGIEPRGVDQSIAQGARGRGRRFGADPDHRRRGPHTAVRRQGPSLGGLRGGRLRRSARRPRGRPEGWVRPGDPGPAHADAARDHGPGPVDPAAAAAGGDRPLLPDGQPDEGPVLPARRGRLRGQAVQLPRAAGAGEGADPVGAHEHGAAGDRQPAGGPGAAAGPGREPAGRADRAGVPAAVGADPAPGPDGVQGAPAGVGLGLQVRPGLERDRRVRRPPAPEAGPGDDRDGPRRGLPPERRLRAGGARRHGLFGAEPPVRAVVNGPFGARPRRPRPQWPSRTIRATVRPTVTSTYTRRSNSPNVRPRVSGAGASASIAGIVHVTRSHQPWTAGPRRRSASTASTIPHAAKNVTAAPHRATTTRRSSTHGSAVVTARNADTMTRNATPSAASAFSQCGFVRGPRTTGSLHSRMRNTQALGSSTPASACAPSVTMSNGTTGCRAIARPATAVATYVARNAGASLQRRCSECRTPSTSPTAYAPLSATADAPSSDASSSTMAKIVPTAGPEVVVSSRATAPASEKWPANAVPPNAAAHVTSTTAAPTIMATVPSAVSTRA